MIIVDVQVPALDMVYDFSLAEDVTVEVLIEELIEMICQRERLAMAKELEEFGLCCVSSGKILPRELTLGDCGVVTGNRLMLI